MQLVTPGFDPSSAHRKRGTAELAIVVVALLAITARIAEVPGHPLVFVRILVSIVAVAFLVLGPGLSLGRRAAVVVAVEAAVGFGTFAMVDVPFVVDHQGQIGKFAASIVKRVDRFARGVGASR